MAIKKKPVQSALLKKPAPAIFNFQGKVKYAILAILAICFYANSFSNEYVLDDEAIIQHNEYVQKGFSGIGKILTSDAYDSYFKQTQANQHLAGGRYRPLSIVLFAVEHQLWGESPQSRHVVNILLYVLCVLAIFYFLRNYLLKKMSYGEDIAFISAILFTIHPIHTEVVANIKSSDEILSMLFIMLTFIFSIKYRETKKKNSLIIALAALFLALLAKEYALTLVLLLPLLFALYFKEKILKAVVSSLPYFGIILLYIVVRIGAIGFPHQAGQLDILNDPYLLATPLQKIASEIFVLVRYLGMLIFPYPLAADYGFAQIPYSSFASPFVWLSVLVYGGVIYWGINLYRQKNMLAFPVFFFLFNLLMISNFILNIGTTMGERLIFHSSLGFVIIGGWGLVNLTKKLNAPQKKLIITSVLGVLILVCFIETINRNNDWKSNFTLFTKDVKTVPNSVLANNKAGLEYVNLSETIKDTVKSDSIAHKGILYLKHAVQLDESDVNGYLNLGIGYCQLIEPDSAKYFWDIAKRLYPEEQHLTDYYALVEKILFYKGQKYGGQRNFKLSIHEFETGIQVDSTNADMWFYLGGTFFNSQQFDSAKHAWLKVKQLNPNYPDLNRCLQMLQTGQ